MSALFLPLGIPFMTFKVFKYYSGMNNACQACTFIFITAWKREQKTACEYDWADEVTLFDIWHNSFAYMI